jgi:hypothetical protein
MMRKGDDKSKIGSQIIALVLIAVLIASISILYIMANGKGQGHNIISTPSTTIQNATEIVPGAFPNAGCPAHLYQSRSVIGNVSGFRPYIVSNVTDYLIAPGNNGKLSYETYTETFASSNQIDFNISAYNVTNWVQFFHAASQNTMQDAHPGINVSINPPSEIFALNSSYAVTVDMNVSVGAAPGTYWVSLSPGFCFGGRTFLLTVGGAPYNGVIASMLVPA